MKTIRTIGILLLVMSFFIGCEFEIYSENTMEANGAMGKIAYSDGSVSEYYDSTKTPIGIVIEVSDEGVAKIVSLTETSANWSTEEVVTNATSRTDGAANMKTIQAIEGWKTEYPAFKWCDDYTDASGNSNWYLPAIDELNQLYHVKSSVNAVIYKIIAGGGTATKLDTGYYWSSSQDDYRNAWFQGFSDGDQSLIKTYNPFSVRAVRAFSTIVNRINVVSTSHKTSYNAGDFLDVSGLIIKVTKSNGSIENVYVTSSMVSGFNSSNVGTQTLTITYGGCTTTFDVEVVENTNITAANVSSVIARLSPGTYTIKMTGKIDNNTLTDIKTAMSGNSNAKINLDLSDTTGLTSIDRAFSGCSRLTSVVIPDSVTSIARYAFSDCYNLESVTIGSGVTFIGSNAFNNSGLTSAIFKDTANWYLYSFGSIDVANKTEAASYLTDVGAPRQYDWYKKIISVSSTDHKISYCLGESLDVSGLTIEVTKYDETTKIVNVTSSMVSGFNPLELGTQTLTITYDGCTTTFDVEVVANVSLTRIEIVSEPDKISYSEGEDFDLEGLIVRACYSDYSTSIVNVTSDMISGFNSSVVGTQTLTITYGGCTTTFNVEVVGGTGKIGDIAYSDGSVSENYDNTKTPVGIVIEVVVGVATKIVSLTETSAKWSTEFVVTNVTSKTDGVANLTAIQSISGWEEEYPAFKWCDDYTDESDNSEWYLPAKDELNLIYKAKDVINTAIEKITAGGGTATKLGTGWYWSSSEYSRNYAWPQVFSDGRQPLYSDLFKDYAKSVRAVRAFSMDTTIVNRINVVSTNHKTSYNAGDFLDVSGLTIEVTRDDGTTKTSNVTLSMISGFDSSIVGTQTLTITYGGCTTTFDVEVVGGARKIGDIAYSDGSVFENYDSTKTPIGIVIEVVDGVATKIVSLTQTSAKWSTEYVSTKATYTTDGVANLIAIQSIDDWEEKYPAFKWCDDYTDESGNSEWYLPAKDELNQLYEVKDTVNAAIDKIIVGGRTATKFGTGWYRSSSQLDSNTAWEQQFSNGQQGNYSKYDTDSVRAVRAFSMETTIVNRINVVSTSHKTSYKVGESLDVSGLTIEVTRDDGTIKTSNVTLSMISGFDSSNVGTQTLTITYGGCTTTFDVEVVENAISTLNITSIPSKTSYYVGDPLDLSGLEIEGVYLDGSTSTLTITSDMVSGFDSSVVGTQTLTITYGGCTTTFDVEVVENAISTLNITSTPSKTSYYVGEPLDLSGLEIEGVYLDGSTSTLTVTSDMVSGFDSSVVGKQTLTITYDGCTTTFDVEVHEIETETVEATASNVYDKVSGLSSGYYIIKVSGEITSSTIADITSAMGYTSAKINLDLSDTTGLTSTGSGTFGSGAFWYCDNLISITLPDGLTSIGNDAFTGCSNLINVVIPESVTEIGHDAFKSCSKLISAEIPEGVTTINEQTFAYCSSLTSVTIPESVTYIDYSAFEDCSSLTTVNYRGTQEQWEQISIGSDNTYLTNATINYNYIGSVLGKVTAIFVNSTSHKISYNAGESLDVSGLTIEVTKEDATTKTVNVTSSMVSGFDSSIVGTQTLTITYGGCTTTFDVTVVGGTNITSSNVSSVIAGLSSGTHTIKMTGEIDNNTISTIKTALRNNSSVYVNLDLSNTTGLTSIGDQDFYGYGNLVGIVIPDSVTSIGSEAFYQCYNLSSVTIGSGVTSIGNSAFYLSSLTSATFKDTTTWYYKPGQYFSEQKINVTAAAQAANYLKDTMAVYAWYKE